MYHELVHWNQQRTWAIRGLGVGLLVWYFLYLFVLPFLWNPFRRRWETEAFRKAEALTDQQIDEVLKRPPYLLRW